MLSNLIYLLIISYIAGLIYSTFQLVFTILSSKSSIGNCFFSVKESFKMLKSKEITLFEKFTICFVAIFIFPLFLTAILES